MKVKGRSLLVIALLLLGGYALWEHLQEKKAAEQEMNDSRLMMLPFDQIERIEVVTGEGKMSLYRNVDGWQMELPTPDSGDNDSAEELVKSAATERIVQVVKEGAGIDWALYGLDQPRATFKFTTSGGKSETFQISAKKNFEEQIYGRRDQEDRVLLLQNNWDRRAGKSFEVFRDRRLLRHRIASVDELKLKNKTGVVHLKMIDGRWKAPASENMDLDQNKVRDLLQTLADAKGASYVETKNLPALKSLLTLDLTMDQKPWSAEIGQAKDLGIYSTVRESKLIMKLEPGALDKLLGIDYKALQSDKPSKEGVGAEEAQSMLALKNEKKEKAK